MTEEKVHGCVKLGIDPSDHNDAQVSYQSNCVDDKKQQEKKCM